MVDSLVGIHPHPRPTKRGVRSRGRAEEGGIRLGGGKGGVGTGEGGGWREGVRARQAGVSSQDEALEEAAVVTVG